LNAATLQTLHLLSGGAAQGLVNVLRGDFQTATGLDIQGEFGAVGVMKDKLLAGAPCDVLVLTQALIEQLTASGQVVPGSARPLGVVKTGVAVKAAEPAPDVSTPEALKAALMAATAIYFPDPVKATAGIHFFKVLQQLGIDGALASRLRPYPNGATAMREMAQCAEPGLIGCTQVTEILYTPNVRLVADLPQAFELATVYTAAVCAKAAHPGAAEALVALLAGAASADARAKAGFVQAGLVRAAQG
jgi:molybdate transport system substrate-binding protein